MKNPNLLKVVYECLTQVVKILMISESCTLNLLLNDLSNVDQVFYL